LGRRRRVALRVDIRGSNLEVFGDVGRWNKGFNEIEDIVVAVGWFGRDE